MKYDITNKISKEWQGKPFVEATLTDDNGDEFKVSAWNGEFNDVNEVELELEKNDKGYWRIRRPKMDKPNFMKAKEAVIEKAVARKEQSIHKFQDNKDWAIKVASSMNKAIDLAIAEYTKNPNSLFNLDECIKKWRKWVWDNWNVDLQDTDALDGTLND
jgi:hypothetical protein